MSMPEGCPCSAVEKLEELVQEHDKQLNQGQVQFALIQQNLEYIKSRLDEKKRFNSGIVSSIIQAACAILMAYIAAKIGLA